MDVYERETPQGVVLSVGGQASNNIAMALFRQNVKVPCICSMRFFCDYFVWAISSVTFWDDAGAWYFP
jgi:hypothetical protein